MDDFEVQMYIKNMTMFDDAEDPMTPIERIIELSNHPSHHIRAIVIHNKSTPIHILEKLCCDEDPDVRECIHLNKRSPIEELKQAEEDLFFLL